jgi:2'-5' RNA ligase
MQDSYSIWLVPQNEDKEYLQSIIQTLAEKYSSPIFIPHITLLADTHLDLEKLKLAVDKIFENIKPFTINKIDIDQCDQFFKTIYLKFELNEMLKNLFLDFSKNTEERNLSTFSPHLSLMYKRIPEKERKKIINDLTIKNEFVIGSVLINKNDSNDYENVNGWQIVYQKELI